MSKLTTTPSLDYLRKQYARQDSLLSSISDMLAKLDKNIQINPEEGKLLQLLMVLRQVKTVVEVGTLAGYSTLWLARAVPEDGHVYTLERDPEHALMARHFFDQSDVANHITLLEGDAREKLAELSSKAPFDMIFIDADKASYNAYLDWAEKNVRPYGLICADNTLLFDTIGLDAPPPGNEDAWREMRRFNDRLADPDRYFTTMVPTNDGLTVAVKLF